MSNTKEKKVINKKTFEEMRQRQIRRRRAVFTTVGVFALVLVLVLGYCFGLYERLLDAMGVERDISVEAVATELEYVPRGAYQIGAIEDCIIIYDENGVTGLDRFGGWKWNLSCTAENPVMNCYKDFLLLTDYNGKTVWAFDKDGQRWYYESDEPVVGAFSTDEGDSVMLLCGQEDFETSVTYLTCNKGVLTPVFTRKFGTYHMIAGTRSANKAHLALSGVYSSGGEMTGAVVFLRVRDGEVFSTVVTEGAVYPVVEYLNKDTVFAANTESLRLIKKTGTASQSGDAEKVLWLRGGGRQAIADAACVGGRACVVAFYEENLQESSGSISTLLYYNNSGREKRTVEIDGVARGLVSQGNTVVAYTDREIYMFNERGNRIGSYKFKSDVKTVSYLDEKVVLVACQSGMVCVSFEGE